MSYQLYPSDLTDREWNLIKRLIPQAKPGGRRRSTDMRLVLNAIFYLDRTGCAWRYLPREYSPWATVYGYFRRWRIGGVWQRSMTACLSGAPARDADRSLRRRILDSQSVMTTNGRPRRGFAPASILGKNDICWLTCSAS